jgi:hypothetical protein
MSDNEYKIGDRIRFKNMPANYPQGVISKIDENGKLICRLSESITYMGYVPNMEEDEGENSVKHKPKTLNEFAINNLDDIEKV